MSDRCATPAPAGTPASRSGTCGTAVSRRGRMIDLRLLKQLLSDELEPIEALLITEAAREDTV